MTDQKRKKAADFLGLKVLSTLDERLIIGGKKREAGVVERHDHHDGVLQHDHHDQIENIDRELVY